MVTGETDPPPGPDDLIEEFQMDLSYMTSEFEETVQEEMYTINTTMPEGVPMPRELIEYNANSLDLIYGMIWFRKSQLKAVSVDEMRTRERIMAVDYKTFIESSRALEMLITLGGSHLDEHLTAVRQQRQRLKDKIAIGQTVVERCVRIYQDWKEKRMVKLTANETDKTAAPIVVKLPLDPAGIINTWGEFDGNPLKWHGFLSSFIAAVHNNPDVPSVAKFKHLQEALKGKAATALGSWDITSENYESAWERLLSLFNRKYPRIQAYVGQIVDLPTLHETTADGLQKMAHTTYEVLRQLKALGLPTDSWDLMIVCMLHAKLDPQTCCEWELNRDNDDDPKLAFMLNFLERRAAAYAHRPSANQTANNQNQNATAQRFKQQSAQTIATPSTSTATKDSTKKVHYCHDCRQAHQVYQCPVFLAMNMSARSQYVEKYKLCPNCLRLGHNIDSCRYQGCFKCTGGPKHNLLLCPLRALRDSPANANAIQLQSRSADET